MICAPRQSAARNVGLPRFQIKLYPPNWPGKVLWPGGNLMPIRMAISLALLLLLHPRTLHGAPTTAPVEQWGIFELALNGPSDGKPYDTKLSAKFTSGSSTIEVR